MPFALTEAGVVVGGDGNIERVGASAETVTRTLAAPG
jgi:hypothetical protein